MSHVNRYVPADSAGTCSAFAPGRWTSAPAWTLTLAASQMRTLCGSPSLFTRNSVNAASAGAVYGPDTKALPWAVTTTAPGGGVGRGVGAPPHAATVAA